MWYYPLFIWFYVNNQWLSGLAVSLGLFLQGSGGEIWGTPVSAFSLSGSNHLSHLDYTGTYKKCSVRDFSHFLVQLTLQSICHSNLFCHRFRDFSRSYVSLSAFLTPWGFWLAARVHCSIKWRDFLHVLHVDFTLQINVGPRIFETHLYDILEWFCEWRDMNVMVGDVPNWWHLDWNPIMLGAVMQSETILNPVTVQQIGH